MNLIPNNPRNIPTFAQFDPGAVKLAMASFLKYVKHVVALLNGSDTADKTITTFSAADLKFEPSGLPQVPDPIRNVNRIETNTTQQQIIRTYLTKQYSELYGGN